jgi:hypothetical protein
MKNSMKRRLDRLEGKVECYVEKIEEQEEMEREHPKARLRNFAEIRASGMMPTVEEVMAAIMQGGPKAFRKLLREIDGKTRGLPSGLDINSRPIATRSGWK